MVVALAAAWLAVGCGASATPPPSSAPTPTPTPLGFQTPWPPFSEPAHADDVYRALIADGIVLSPISADAGAGGRDPVKRIQATYEGSPLQISEFKSAKSLATATHWSAGAQPGPREAPIAMIGENILVQWGPIATTAPTAPTAGQLASAEKLRASLERLVGPLAIRSIVPFPAGPAGSSPSDGPTASP
jgi:hypothetical protein